MKYAITIIAVCFMALSCRQAQDREDLKIITTTSFVSEAVARIAGDKIEIKNLMKYGQDPHSYEPAPRDIAALEKAGLIFINGFDLEEGLLKILESGNKEKIISLSSSVEPIEHKDEHEPPSGDHDHEIDPHTWMSPLNMIKWIEIVTESLSSISPDNSSYFEANKKSYEKELMDLHRNIREKVSALDEKEKVLITDHDSFAYFAREYGFALKGSIIRGTSSNSDTSSSEIIELIKQLRQSEISTIFIGDTSGPDMMKLAENIKVELNYPVEIVLLKTGSLGIRGSETDSYIKYMTYNTDLIINALKGDQ